MNKTEIKEWVKNHKKELIVGSVSLAVGAIGGVKLYQFSRRDVESWKNSVIEVYNTLLPAMRGSYGAYINCDLEDNPRVKDCPKLIQELLECDFVNPDEKITGIAVFRKKEN